MATAAKAVIGHNNPPEESPYDAMKIHIEDLFLEATNFLDGDPVTTQEMADAIDAIKAKALEAEKDGDELRKAEAKPFDDGKKAVQERWNPLVHKETGKCRLIVQTCAKALAPYLKVKQDALDAEAARQRKIADDLAEEARLARATAPASDLTARVEADAALQAAADAQKQADRATNARAQAKGGKRATSLRDVWTPVLVEPKEALRHYMQAQREELLNWLLSQAEKDVRIGKREIPGFRIDHDRVAV
jgi:hypothetical protein